MGMTQEQWLELRRTHVGSSEVAYLFSPELAQAGETVRHTRFELWHWKAGLIPEPDPSQPLGDEDDDPVFWGNVLEPAIAHAFAGTRGLKIRRLGQNRYIRHKKVRGMGATGDYEILGDPRGPGLLEIKNLRWSAYLSEWPADDADAQGNRRPPLKFLLQVQHQMACTGRRWGFLVPLVGGSKLAPVELERHDATIAKVERGVSAFWESIDRREPPPPDWQADADAVAALYRSADVSKALRLDDPELARLCEQYCSAREVEKLSLAEKKTAKAQILARIGDAAEAVVSERAGGGYRILAKPVHQPAYAVAEKDYRGFNVYDRRPAPVVPANAAN